MGATGMGILQRGFLQKGNFATRGAKLGFRIIRPAGGGKDLQFGISDLEFGREFTGSGRGRAMNRATHVGWTEDLFARENGKTGVLATKSNKAKRGSGWGVTT